MLCSHLFSGPDTQGANFPAPGRIFSLAALVLLGLSPAARLCAEPAGTPAGEWKTTAALTARETYDSNVFMQDIAPNPAVADAVPARLASLVTSLSATVGVEHRFSPALTLAASYAPEAIRYHSASSEDNIVHRAGLNFSGTAGAVAWSLTNSGVWTDGSKDAPIFGGPGGAPAIGGAPVRDRRAAFAERSNFKLSAVRGPWLVRAVATTYWHDFQTRQTTLAGCSNYIDRSEVLGGVEGGYALWPKTRLIAGYRFGRQNQGKLLGVDSPYDSWMRRLVAGVEGSPCSWLQLNLLAGRETRTFGPGTPVGFNRHNPLWWVDASATATPTKNDALQLSFRRIRQPSSSSVSVYDDAVAEITWKHKCTDRFSAGAGLKACIANWQAPAIRRDRIYTPSLQLQYAFSKQFSAEIACSRDIAESQIKATEGREFTRNLCTLGLKRTF